MQKIIINKIKYLFIITILAIGTFFSGIRWGLPSQKLSSLYFIDNESRKLHNKTIEKYPLADAFKGMGVYVVQHPNEEEKKLPRNLYNPIRSYHPDEYYVIKSLGSMNPVKLDFNPHQFGICGVYLYFIGVLLFLLEKIHFVKLVKDLGFYFLHPEEIAKLYIVGRVVTAFYGVGVVLLSYLLCKKISKSESWGFFTGFSILFSPLILLNSHYMYVDIPGVFWIITSLYMTVLFVEKFSFRKLFIAGALAGFAGGTKITFLTSFIIPLFGLLLIWSGWKKLLKEVVLVTGGFITSFALTNPYFFITFPEPLIELKQHTGLSFQGKFYILSLIYGLGLPLLLFILAGFLFVLITLKRKGTQEKKIIFLFIFWIIFFFVFISIFSKNFSRYILPIVPVSIILSGIGWYWFFENRGKIERISAIVFIIIVMCFTFVYGMSYELLFISKNIRTEAGEWIKENISKGSTIGVSEFPWQFQMPPFDYFKYKVIVTGYNTKSVIQKSPKYIIFSSLQVPIPPYSLKLESYRINFWKEFQNLNLYKPIKIFQKYPSFLMFHFHFQTIPEDLIYLNPTIIIFEKI